jgi:hypothetical protein
MQLSFLLFAAASLFNIVAGSRPFEGGSQPTKKKYEPDISTPNVILFDYKNGDALLNRHPQKFQKLCNQKFDKIWKDHGRPTKCSTTTHNVLGKQVS